MACYRGIYQPGNVTETFTNQGTVPRHLPTKQQYRDIYQPRNVTETFTHQKHATKTFVNQETCYRNIYQPRNMLPKHLPTKKRVTEAFTNQETCYRNIYQPRNVLPRHIPTNKHVTATFTNQETTPFAYCFRSPKYTGMLLARLATNQRQ